MISPALTFQDGKASPSFLDSAGEREETESLGTGANSAEIWEEVADLRESINKPLL